MGSKCSEPTEEVGVIYVRFVNFFWDHLKLQIARSVTVHCTHMLRIYSF